MPGEIYRTLTLELRTVMVSCQFSKLDEDHLGVNAATYGGFAPGYLPQSILTLHSRESDDPNSPPQSITVGPATEETDAALLADLRKGVFEFFVMPKCHLLVGKIMRGEHVDGPGLQGGDAWRTRFDGVEYNMHDGSGNFVITAPEPVS